MTRPDRFDRRLAAQRRDLAAKKPDQWTCRHCLRRFVVPELHPTSRGEVPMKIISKHSGQFPCPRCWVEMSYSIVVIVSAVLLGAALKAVLA